MAAAITATIEVNDDNRFNYGWLLYLLAQPKPDHITDPLAADGWDMAQNTPSLVPVRNVFDGDHSSAYTVSVKAPKPEPTVKDLVG